MMLINLKGFPFWGKKGNLTPFYIYYENTFSVNKSKTNDDSYFYVTMLKILFAVNAKLTKKSDMKC